MPHISRDIQPEEFKNYVEELAVEALRAGTVSPSALLECLYYAAEAELTAAIRAFASLDAAERLMVMSYARRLSDEKSSTH